MFASRLASLVPRVSSAFRVHRRRSVHPARATRARTRVRPRGSRRPGHGGVLPSGALFFRDRRDRVRSASRLTARPRSSGRAPRLAAPRDAGDDRDGVRRRRAKRARGAPPRRRARPRQGIRVDRALLHRAPRSLRGRVWLRGDKGYRGFRARGRVFEQGERPFVRPLSAARAALPAGRPRVRSRAADRGGRVARGSRQAVPRVPARPARHRKVDARHERDARTRVRCVIGGIEGRRDRL